jgi:isopentenyl diphosphate isomerase/L-lactate dehydrogenase-like FMN-dependent dehydrogenase
VLRHIRGELDLAMALAGCSDVAKIEHELIYIPERS